jgi:glycosyltransferase involved in cell wall biosynthesis
VATHVGGIPDLLEGGRFGTLVSSGNAHAFAQAILDALENPPDTTAAQAAMLNQYGIDRLVSDLAALYKGLLARKRR